MQALSTSGRFLLAALLAGGLVGCRTFATKQTEEEAAAVPSAPESDRPTTSTVLPVGVVHHVDAAGGFVLVRSSRSLRIEPGTILTVRGAHGEAVSRLEVSPARKGAFLTADIVEGAPEPGRHVTLDYAPSPLGGEPTPVVGAEDPNAVQVLE